MNNITDQSLPPQALYYLPGIYQELGAIPQTPLRALVTIIDDFFNQVEKQLEFLPEIFDPDTTPFDDKHPDKDFLSWLAQWVLLPLDRDLLSGDNAADGQRIMRRLIKDAALLYRLRGTALGLRYMAEVLFDLEIKIIERAWPLYMVIGESSIIEEQTFLIDAPDRARAFILAIQLGSNDYRDLKKNSNAWLEVPYIGETPSVSGILLEHAGGVADADNEEARLLKKLRKLKQYVEQEKPIHTQCFIAFQRLENR